MADVSRRSALLGRVGLLRSAFLLLFRGGIALYGDELVKP